MAMRLLIGHPAIDTPASRVYLMFYLFETKGSLFRVQLLLDLPDENTPAAAENRLIASFR